MFITLGQGGVDFEPKKGGLRTEIGVSPVRVWVKRGAERGGTRLRGEEILGEVRFGVYRGEGKVLYWTC